MWDMPVFQPASPAFIPDPGQDRDALDVQERRALSRRPTWTPALSLLLFVGLGLAALACVVFLSTRGPVFSKDAERPRVRQAALAHLFEDFEKGQVGAETVYCIALFGGVDPRPHFLERFDGGGRDVRSLSQCRDDVGTQHLRDFRLFEVGAIKWIHGGDVEIRAGVDLRAKLRLRQSGGNWQVVGRESLW
jgi:hypothetical protein